MSNNTPEQNFSALGLSLPPAPTPMGVYKPCLIDGKYLYVSGHGPFQEDKTLIIGRVGQDMDIEAGKLAARQTVTPPKTVQAFTGDIRILVSETGTIEPMKKVDVRSKVAGRLISLPVQEGQRVTAGQLIAIVDRSQLDPQIARQRALLDQFLRRCDLVKFAKEAPSATDCDTAVDMVLKFVEG